MAKSETPTIKNTSGLEEYRKKKAALDAEVEGIKAAAAERFNKLVAEAAEVAADYKKEFGTRVPSPFTVTKVQAAGSGNDGRALGGLKRALAAAKKRNDTAKVTEIEAKIAALAPPTPAPAQ